MTGSGYEDVIPAPKNGTQPSRLQDAESEESGAMKIESTISDDPSPTYINRDAERMLLRKLDWTLLPLFTVIYITNFVDRTAIGNAKIAGLEKDLGMSGFDYNNALTIFYVVYIIAEIPSNLALKHFGSIWLALMVTTFGATTIGTAFVRDYKGLIITRVFLGITEGGLLSGLVYILSRYYRRSELILRIGIFFGLAPTLSGAFGGLIASGLLSINDIGSVTSWRKIFLVEGIITTAIGLIGFVIIPEDPQSSRMFTDSERALIIARMSADQIVVVGARKERTTLSLVGRAFNFNTWLCSLCYLLLNISFQGMSIFLPTVISTYQFTATVEAQLRTVPPFVTGSVLALILSYVSLRSRHRAAPIMVTGVLQTIGYAIFVTTKNPHARYAACFLAVGGGSPGAPLLLAWGTDNAAPDTVRAAVTAIIPSIGSLGAVISVWTYLPADAPDYHHGTSLNLAAGALTCVLIVVGALYIRWENAKRERGDRDYRLYGKSDAEIEQLGYLHPKFRYQM
ncbi:hypothetical protein M0805_007823 [Coniferiporia weirii]|nr:hypothetical protein M0805_007823 [Coniferiporia weirii]